MHEPGLYLLVKQDVRSHRFKAGSRPRAFGCPLVHALNPCNQLRLNSVLRVTFMASHPRIGAGIKIFRRQRQNAKGGEMRVSETARDYSVVRIPAGKGHFPCKPSSFPHCQDCVVGDVGLEPDYTLGRQSFIATGLPAG